MADKAPQSYAKLNRPIDPSTISVVHEIDAILRTRCPMQKKWISVRGKRTSCPWCPYLHKIRYTEWGAKIECKYEDGRPIYAFPMHKEIKEDSDDES